jgi:hypothetical protein
LGLGEKDAATHDGKQGDGLFEFSHDGCLDVGNWNVLFLQLIIHGRFPSEA